MSHQRQRAHHRLQRTRRRLDRDAAPDQVGRPLRADDRPRHLGLRIGKDNCLVLDFAGNVERHGPIDRIDGRKRKDGDDRESRRFKACQDCGTIVHASTRICPTCGHAFPPPKPDLSRTASTSAILSSQIRAEWLTVTAVTYHHHDKPGSPPSLRVEYHRGLAGHPTPIDGVPMTTLSETLGRCTHGS